MYYFLTVCGDGDSLYLSFIVEIYYTIFVLLNIIVVSTLGFTGIPASCAKSDVKVPKVSPRKGCGYSLSQLMLVLFLLLY